MRFFDRSMRFRLLAVGLPFFRAETRRALVGFAILVTLLLGINGLNVVNSYVGRDFMSALAERRTAQFYALAGALAGVFAVSTLVEVFARYAEQWLGLKWRDWLTRQLFDRYLANRTYLRLAGRHDIDNPDQRISEDVRTFTETALSIFVLAVNGVMTLAAFSGVLWSISPWLFAAAVGYALAGSLGTVLLGRRLVGLNNRQFQREADLRFALGRVREHAEALAQTGGEAGQKSRLRQHLAGVVANFRAIIGLSRNLGFFTTGYGYLPQIIPAMIVAPLYIRGEVEFGTVTQAAMAFSQVQGAFSIVVTQFQGLSTFAAVVGRLGALWEATAPGPPEPALAGPLPTQPAAPEPSGLVVQTVPEARRVAYDRLTLWTPDRERPLVRDLSLEVPEGRRVAVTGPDGGCHAALLNAAAGLWAEGRGRVLSPGRGGVMFVPCRPAPGPGRLRDLLGAGLGRAVADEELHAALRDVGLEEAVARHGGLDADRDWSRDLSAGEQWALAVARLLLARPRFALLDGPDGVPAPAQADAAYRALSRSPITYLSLGCPPALLAYHDLRLEIHPDGTWQVGPVPDQAAPTTDGAHQTH
jgi:putative ATP-binding cassette transporter